MTIAQALNKATKKLQLRQISSARLDAEVLLGFILKKPREYLLAHDEKIISDSLNTKFEQLIDRRRKYEPIAYIIGQKEFYGLNIIVNNKVLIPRPDTELLVEETINIAKKIDTKKAKLAILDIGTGSGAIALALKQSLPKARILASDSSVEALKLARLNARKLSLRVDILKSDLLASPAVKRAQCQIMVANLPYLGHHETIKTLKHENKKSLEFEPESALFAKKSGTAIYEELFKQINSLIKPPQYLIIEIGSYQYKKFIYLAKKYFKYAEIILKRDLAKRPRLLIIKL